MSHYRVTRESDLWLVEDCLAPKRWWTATASALDSPPPHRPRTASPAPGPGASPPCATYPPTREDQ